MLVKSGSRSLRWKTFSTRFHWTFCWKDIQAFKEVVIRRMPIIDFHNSQFSSLVPVQACRLPDFFLVCSSCSSNLLTVNMNNIQQGIGSVLFGTLYLKITSTLDCIKKSILYFERDPSRLHWGQSILIASRS